MSTVTGIYRYPVKGLSPEPLENIVLDSGRPFPCDRIFALARPGSPIDPEQPAWAKKGLFVMLMLHETLALVQTRLDAGTGQFEVRKGGERVLAADLGTAEGAAALEAFVEGLVPGLGGRPRLVRSREGHFMDKPDNVVSLINLATVRSLEREWGRRVDPLRFRANFYVDGFEPWEEFGWVGGDLRLGGAMFRVDRRNGRCGATNVDPSTGKRDMDIPMVLRRAYGHKDLGVYLVVSDGGRVAVGDTVVAPPPVATSPVSANSASAYAPGPRRHICRGCFFIYDEAAGLPAADIAPGTAFADLPPQRLCSDCGASRETFSPYAGGQASGAPLQGT